MSKCSTKIPIEAYNHMEGKVSEIKEIFVTQGRITEEDMDSAGILNIDLRNHKPKGQRALHQQTAVAMNSSAIVEFCKLYNARQQEATVQRAVNAVRNNEKRREKRRFEELKDEHETWFEELSKEDHTDERRHWKAIGSKKQRIETWVSQGNAAN